MINKQKSTKIKNVLSEFKKVSEKRGMRLINESFDNFYNNLIKGVKYGR